MMMMSLFLLFRCQYWQRKRRNKDIIINSCRAKDAACGLLYLASENIVHADIGLRNVLVTRVQKNAVKFVAKIADFGLSKKIQGEYYTTEATNLPIRWTAPEVIG